MHIASDKDACTYSPPPPQELDDEFLVLWHGYDAAPVKRRYLNAPELRDFLIQRAGEGCGRAVATRDARERARACRALSHGSDRAPTAFLGGAVPSPHPSCAAARMLLRTRACATLCTRVRVYVCACPRARLFKAWHLSHKHSSSRALAATSSR